jgi:hypothetical protein
MQNVTNSVYVGLSCHIMPLHVRYLVLVTTQLPYDSTEMLNLLQHTYGLLPFGNKFLRIGSKLLPIWLQITTGW